jgi:hypothetical protein
MKGLVLAVIAVSMLGCARKGPPVQARVLAPANLEKVDESALREKRPRIGQSAVYVDGKLVSSLAIQELPSGYGPLHSEVRHGAVIARYGLASYVAALGIDLKTVKAVHLHGSRVSFITGDQLRQYGDKNQFSFTAGDHGKPRIHYAHGARFNTTIDIAKGIAIYVDKEPPHEDDHYNLVYPDGKPVGDGIAYAPAEQGSGTRVYVDGALVAIMKRKALTNDLLATNDLSKPVFSLASFLDKAGVTGKVKAVDLIANDELVARRASTKDLTFAVPARNQGLAVMAIDGNKATVSAVQLFVKKEPPKKTVTPITDEAAEPADRSVDDKG